MPFEQGVIPRWDAFDTRYALKAHPEIKFNIYSNCTQIIKIKHWAAEYEHGRSTKLVWAGDLEEILKYAEIIRDTSSSGYKIHAGYMCEYIKEHLRRSRMDKPAIAMRASKPVEQPPKPVAKAHKPAAIRNKQMETVKLIVRKVRCRLPDGWKRSIEDTSSVDKIIERVVDLEYMLSGIVAYAHCLNVREFCERKHVLVGTPHVDYGAILQACEIGGISCINEIVSAMENKVSCRELDMKILRDFIGHAGWTRVRLEFLKSFDKYYYMHVWHSRLAVMDFNCGKQLMSMDGFNSAFWRERDAAAEKGKHGHSKTKDRKDVVDDAKEAEYKAVIMNMEKDNAAKAAEFELKYSRKIHEIAALEHELDTITERYERLLSDDTYEPHQHDLCEQPEDDGQSECVVCLDRPRVVAAIPCGHMIYCSDCSLGMKGKDCAICRAPVQMLVPIFQ